MRFQLAFIILCAVSLTISCNSKAKPSDPVNNTISKAETTFQIPQEFEILNPDGYTILSRFSAPAGFERITTEDGSFAKYLQSLPLKPIDAEVKLYNGQIKGNKNAHISVIDMEIGDKDLHQCADAIMRLRAEYFWTNEMYDSIHFNFTNGFRVDYYKWIEGQRVVVNGNNCYWNQSASPSNTYSDFWKYMEQIFMYAGSLSLSKEMNPIELDQMRIGDVFILGGSPGHAVLVVDMAQNPETGEKLFMLAQSYMPAQETHVLRNPGNPEISPWYSINFEETLTTPEWSFKRDQLMRF